MPHEEVGRLSRQDIEEKRVKCDYCASELTFLEFFYIGNKCVFCSEEGLTPIKNMSKLAYGCLLRHDLEVVRQKLSMKKRGLTVIDWQACVNVVKPDLRFIDNKGDMKKLLEAMKGHGLCKT